MSKFYIRKIGTPTDILAFGHGEPGKYASIPLGFEEVEGELPKGYKVIKALNITEQLNAALDAVEANERVPVALRAAVRPLRVTVADAIEAGALDEASYIIANFTVPDKFAPLKQELLDILTKAIG